MRRLVKWVVAVVVIIILGVGGYWLFQQHKTTTTEQDKTPATKQVKLVAIGDSLTQGIGYANDHKGYLPDLKNDLQKAYYVKLSSSNYGIGGLRSDQIDKRVRTNQKERASLKKANVITLTVGGNDLLQSLEKSIFVSSNKQLDSKLTPVKKTYRKKVQRLIKDIRAVNPNATIYMFGIYNPVYVYFTNATMITNAVAQWNVVNKSVAQQSDNVHFVSISKQLTYGQYQSAASKAKLKQEVTKSNSKYVSASSVESLLQNQTSKEKNDYLSDEDHFHPNHRGYRYMAKTLAGVMGKYESWQSK
ncbi:hypothetical protein AYR62_05960 [Secundilactobacillus paracollinoides]|uniref:GDSL-type esterase/lipase family protein n=1 Tax=Secundilactobacillus paracollinoides TaxID=240427 RepID=UPI0006CFE698|nr:GDSL-type esterase/lipase family protein [Secundilactobacillus paracollinoides]ANZ63682.1 hypothetical protein AYR62_05960 [Secundilactobacillus paracollinoides]